MLITAALYFRRYINLWFFTVRHLKSPFLVKLQLKDNNAFVTSATVILETICVDYRAPQDIDVLAVLEL